MNDNMGLMEPYLLNSVEDEHLLELPADRRAGTGDARKGTGGDVEAVPDSLETFDFQVVNETCCVQQQLQYLAR